MMARKSRRAASAPSFEQEYVNDVIAARIVGVSAPTLRRWRCEGRGPKVCKLGGLVRYRVSDLRAWAQAQEVA
jgi:predicted DNA-binding transcriptional regulator AlpA